MLTIAGLLIEAEYQINVGGAYLFLFLIDCILTVGIYDLIKSKAQK